MARTRRALLGTLSAIMVGSAGCSLTPEHGHEILLRNDREVAVSITIRGTNVRTGERTLDETLELDPGETDYVVDPSQTGSQTPHQITVNTERGNSVSRQWAPANPGQQLKVLVDSHGLSLEVGPVE